MIKNISLLKNIASLGALQAFNFTLTLATLPYLARTLGVFGWGSAVFVQLIVNYFIWVANWGFYLGATKRIAELRENQAKQSRVFISTWVAQWCMTIVLLLTLVITTVTIPSFHENWELFFSASGLLIGNVLMPLWYLNGLEKIKESALIQITVKIVALPFIFLLVNSAEDTVVYLWINSVSSILIGAMVVIWIHRSNFFDYIRPTLLDIRTAVTKDYQLFISTIWANINSTVVPTTLGIIGGEASLGYYNLADRARSAAIQVLHPITNALFPRMCYLFTNEKTNAIRLLKLSGGFLLISSIILSLCLYFWSEEIISLLGGASFQEGSSVLEILAFSPLFTTMSAFVIHQIVIPSGEFKMYVRSIFLTLILSLILVYPVITALGVKGAAITSISTELLTLCFLLLYIRSKNIFEKK